MRIGYARVSTKRQGESLETQKAALEDAGCRKLFADTISGAKSARPGLDDALAYMREDDVLVVTRLDRLGRTTLDTLRTIDDLNGRGIPVILLDPALDTRTKEGKLMVTIMSGLAEWERDLLIERTREGVANARERGRVAGPKPKLSPEQAEAVRAAVDSGQTITSVARSFGVSRPTIYKALQKNVRETQGSETSPWPQRSSHHGYRSSNTH